MVFVQKKTFLEKKWGDVTNWKCRFFVCLFLFGLFGDVLTERDRLPVGVERSWIVVVFLEVDRKTHPKNRATCKMYLYIDRFPCQRKGAAALGKHKLLVCKFSTQISQCEDFEFPNIKITQKKHLILMVNCWFKTFHDLVYLSKLRLPGTGWTSFLRGCCVGLDFLPQNSSLAGTQQRLCRPTGGHKCCLGDSGNELHRKRVDLSREPTQWPRWQGERRKWMWTGWWSSKVSLFEWNNKNLGWVWFIKFRILEDWNTAVVWHINCL